MGITIESFWLLTPRLLDIYLKADKINQKEKDRAAHLQGLYVYEAMAVVMHNAFCDPKKGEKPIKYREKCISDEYEEKHRVLTPEEQQRKADLYFHQLEIARFNQQLAEM